jgi:hypothetical protein
LQEFNVITKGKKFDFEHREKDSFVFRWIDLQDISDEDLSLPIDKIVGRLLREEFRR